MYAPQEDSRLLVETMRRSAAVEGRTVLDLCTGSGIAAIAAAQLGAEQVTAFDVCRRAVRCARRNARAVGVRIKARVGTLSDALICGPFDVLLSNPPYVPTGPADEPGSVPADAGPSRAWDAGPDGRMVLDPLCDSAAGLLSETGVLLVVQSEFADPDRSLRMLRRTGVDAAIVAEQHIPFGPVLSARAEWMQRAGLVESGRRQEKLVVIRGEKR